MTTTNKIPLLTQTKSAREGIMLDDKLIIGMALGFIVGAIVVHSNKKVQQVIEDGKEKIKEKIEQM